MGIGFRYPQNLTPANGSMGITIEILAGKGLVSPNILASQVQLVWDGFCRTPAGSVLAFTDCMGVYTTSYPGPEGVSRMNLNRFTNLWDVPPARCWLAYNYGNNKMTTPPCEYGPPF